MPRARPVVAFLLALALLGVAFAQEEPDRTRVRVFTPFVPGGGPVVGLAVDAETRGTCFSESVADPGRPDAWRCTDVDSAIHDPCFENPFGERLACAEAPFPAEATLLELDEPLPEAPRDPLDLEALPWALELANGRRCTMLTGTLPLVAGMRMVYACGENAWAGEAIDRSDAVWTVFSWTEDRSLALDQVEVRTAWY